MKTIRAGLLALTLLLLPSAALAQATLIGTIGADSHTTPVSAAAPLPVTGTVTATSTAQTGAGAVTATTARTVTAADSPDVESLDAIETYTGASHIAAGALQATTGALSAAAPTSAQLLGLTDSVSGLLMPARAFDSDTGAGNDFRLGTVPLLAGAGGGTPASAGAGAVDAGTLRTTLGATDPAVVSLQLIDDAFSDSGVATSKGVTITARTPGPGTQAYLYNTNNALWTDLHMVAGKNVGANVGNVAPGTLQVVQAAISTGTSNQTAVDASEVAVLAAKIGRRYARVQVYADTDGGVCCALGATTNACADGILLDASPAAGKAGGSAEWEGYGGAITCRAAGAWTTTVASEEW